MERTVTLDEEQVLKLPEEILAQLRELNKKYETPAETAVATEEEDNSSLMRSISPIIDNYNYLKSVKSLNVELDDQYAAKDIISLLDNLYPIYVESISRKLKKPDCVESEVRSQLRQINREIALILNDITFDSIKFCHTFLEFNGLTILFKYLSNEALLEYYAKTYALNIDPNPEFDNIDYTIRPLTSSITCLARTYSSYKSEWKKNNGAKHLLNYLKKTAHMIDNKMYACLALAFIADDEDIERMPQVKEIIPLIADLIAEAAKMIEEEPGLKRELIELEGSKEITEVYCVKDAESIWSILDLMKGLYHLSVSDKLKYDIYRTFGMSVHLRSIIFNGNSVEKEYALLLLWQLCLDKRVAAKTCGDAELFKYIKALGLNRELDKKLVANAAGLTWLLEKSVCNPADLRRQVANDSAAKKHIMISYNSDNKDVCLKIKEDLEKEGYTVWIDNDVLQGSNLGHSKCY